MSGDPTPPPAPEGPPDAEEPVEVVDTGRPARSNPRFSIIHEADVPWTEVRAQQHGDRRVSVHEKFLEWSTDRMVVLGHYDPGMIVERHGHRSDHLVYVMEGAVDVGGRHCPAGTLIVLEEGAAFGPLIADADEGCLMFETWLDDPLPVRADEAGFHALLDEHGAVELPNPPFEPPPHLSGPT